MNQQELHQKLQAFDSESERLAWCLAHPELAPPVPDHVRQAIHGQIHTAQNPATGETVSMRIDAEGAWILAEQIPGGQRQVLIGAQEIR